MGDSSSQLLGNPDSLRYRREVAKVTEVTQVAEGKVAAHKLYSAANYIYS